MSVMPPDESLPAVANRYVLVEQLAGDERHEVWRGHDDFAGRQVLITRYLATTDEWRTVFARRARQLEALSDPGVASTLAHDADDDPPWVVTAFVEGATAARIADDPGLTTDDALAVIGQTALALAAAHSAAIGHGNVSAEHVRVRPDGSVAVVGFALDRSPATGEDVSALVRLAHRLLDDDVGATPADDVASFLQLLDRGDWRDPGDIGRTALALAAAQRVGDSAAVLPEPSGEAESAPEPPRPWYDEAERKQVRNRLIALAAIVVLGGVALLRIFASGAGETSVPSVIGEPWGQAQHDLNEQGLRASERLTSGPAESDGTVIAQSPHGGQRVKVGSVVSLTVASSS